MSPSGSTVGVKVMGRKKHLRSAPTLCNFHYRGTVMVVILKSPTSPSVLFLGVNSITAEYMDPTVLFHLAFVFPSPLITIDTVWSEIKWQQCTMMSDFLQMRCRLYILISKTNVYYCTVSTWTFRPSCPVKCQQDYESEIGNPRGRFVLLTSAVQCKLNLRV